MIEKVKFETIQNVFKASVELLISPKSCFERTNDGYLEVAGVGAFFYWLIVTMLEGLMFAFTSTGSGFFSWGYFAAIGCAAFVRMIPLLAVWVFFAKFFRLNDIRPAVSICLFSTAILSFFMYLLLLGPLQEVGLEKVLAGHAPSELLEKHRIQVYVIRLMKLCSPFFVAVYVAGFYKKITFFLRDLFGQLRLPMDLSGHSLLFRYQIFLRAY